MTRSMWTIAYRKPRANRFLRVTNWQGTWAQALAVSQVFAAAHPELQVWYVPTAASDANGAPEDIGNILVDTGRRVRIVEGGDELLTTEMIARVPAAEVAEERWHNGEPIADAEGVEPLAPLSQVAAEHGYEVVVGTFQRNRIAFHRGGQQVAHFEDAAAAREWLAHREAQRLLGTIRIDGRPQVVTELLEQAELLTDCAEHLALVRRIVELDRELRVAAAAEALLAA